MDPTPEFRKLDRSVIPPAATIVWNLTLSYAADAGVGSLNWTAVSVETIPLGLSVRLTGAGVDVDMRTATVAALNLADGNGSPVIMSFQITISSGAAAPPPTSNKLANGGFENGTGIDADNWTLYWTVDEPVERINTTPQAGLFALQITSNSNGSFVQANQSLNATENGTGILNLNADVKKVSGNQTSAGIGFQVEFELVGNGSYFLDVGFASPAVGPYQHFAFDVRVPPGSTRLVDFSIDTTGRGVWQVDNLTLINLPPTQCSDGVDNDFNNLSDFPDDPGCTGVHDQSESGFVSGGPAICSNGQDDDFDGFIDLSDPGCDGPDDQSEFNDFVGGGFHNITGHVLFEVQPGSSSGVCVAAFASFDDPQPAGMYMTGPPASGNVTVTNMSPSGSFFDVFYTLSSVADGSYNVVAFADNTTGPTSTCDEPQNGQPFGFHGGFPPAMVGLFGSDRSNVNIIILANDTFSQGEFGGPSGEFGFSVCNDGIDNDNDGMIDNQDPDCSGGGPGGPGGPGGVCLVGSGGATLQGFVLSEFGDPATFQGLGIKNTTSGSFVAGNQTNETGFYQCSVNAGPFTVEMGTPDFGYGSNSVTVTGSDVVNRTVVWANITLSFNNRPQFQGPTTFYGGTINGTIRFNNGTNITGARISVFPHFEETGPGGGEAPPPQDPNSIFNQFGYAETASPYSITRLANGSYDMFIEAPGVGSAFIPNQENNITFTNVNQNSVSLIYFNYTFSPPGSISGRVTQTNGSGVAGANINAFGQSGGGFTQTDATGNYTLNIAPGTYGMQVEPPFGSPLERASLFFDFFSGTGGVTVTQGNTTIQNFTLGVGASIGGRVVDGSGNPIAFANVNVFSDCFGPGPCDFRYNFGQSNATGVFNLTGTTPGSYRYRVEPPFGTGFSTNESSSSIAVTAGNHTNLGDIVLRTGGSMTGCVRDDNGAPLSNLFINVFPFIEGPGGFFGGGGFGQTNSTGCFLVRGLVAGNYSVEVNPPFGSDLRRFRQDRVQLNDSEAKELGNITLSTGGAIQGFIFTGAGAPVSRAFVNAFKIQFGPPGANQDFSGSFGFAQSDANGFYRIGGLSNGSFGMFVDPPFGSGLSSAQVDPFGTGESILVASTAWRNFTLDSGGILTGRVTDGTSAVQNAWVNVFSFEGGWGGAPTGPDGRFTIDGLRSANYQLNVFPPFGSSLTSAQRNNINVTAGSTTDIGFVNLSAGITISGKINKTDGTNVSNAFINAWEIGSFGFFGAFGFAQSNFEGDYTIRGLNAGTYNLRVEAPFGSGLSSVEAQNVVLNESIVRNFTLGAGGSISGQVFKADTGDGMNFANVWVYSPTTNSGGGGQTNITGHFNVSGLAPANDYGLFVDPGFFNSAYQSTNIVPINVTSGNTTTGLITQFSGAVANLSNISLGRGGEIFGRVIDSSGNGVSFAFVNAFVEGGSFGWTMTGGDGRFTVRGLSDPGSSPYHLRIDPPQGSVFVPTSVDVSWAASGSTDAGNITLSGGKTVTGYVFQSDGTTPISGANVNIWSPALFGAGGSTTTNATGFYNLSGLPASTFDVNVDPGSGQPPRFFGAALVVNATGDCVFSGTSKPGCADVNVVLQSPGNVRFRVTDGASNQPNVYVNLWDDSTGFGRLQYTNSTGNTSFTDLPPGNYSYQILLPGCIPVLQVDNLPIAAGDNGEVLVTLSASTPWYVRGNLTGANVSGISVLIIRNATASNATGLGSFSYSNFTVTNTTGFFQFGLNTSRDVPEGVYELRFLNSTGSQIGNSTMTVVQASSNYAGSAPTTSREALSLASGGGDIELSVARV
ncbi:MAG: carboxypeptidase regulatory-like domain-containing protein [Euryarchaeota archaeon]|nr:carboxypeptidase regulatory-like domain-containing protein [Euryarchaeota archaeon]